MGEDLKAIMGYGSPAARKLLEDQDQGTAGDPHEMTRRRVLMAMMSVAAMAAMEGLGILCPRPALASDTCHSEVSCVHTDTGTCNCASCNCQNTCFCEAGLCDSCNCVCACQACVIGCASCASCVSCNCHTDCYSNACYACDCQCACNVAVNLSTNGVGPCVCNSCNCHCFCNNTLTCHCNCQDCNAACNSCFGRCNCNCQNGACKAFYPCNCHCNCNSCNCAHTDTSYTQCHTNATDCGMRTYDSKEGTEVLACEPSGTVTSAVRVYNGQKYGLILVPVGDPNASSMRVETKEGTMAVRKYP